MKNFGVVLTLLNVFVIGSFWYRFSAPIADSTAAFFSSSDSLGVFLSSQANHYALLQIYLVLFSIAIAVAAIWGYNEIKKEAAKKAEKRVKDVVPKVVKDCLKELSPEDWARLLVEAKMTASSAQNAEEAFNKNIDAVVGGPDV